ncbi:MAG TPA: hypothetical protein VG755_14520 [Nannocystaceae bacterium]|nr:hypothetical protein [Nannocystaceae bacterium]
MPLLLDQTSVLQCPHGLPIQHPPSQVRVLLSGAPALTVADIGTITGCPFTIPPSKPSPCVTTQWLQGAVRVKIGGVPALLQSSPGLCKSPEQAPQGPPLPCVVQPRVQGV